MYCVSNIQDINNTITEITDLQESFPCLDIAITFAELTSIYSLKYDLNILKSISRLITTYQVGIIIAILPED